MEKLYFTKITMQVAGRGMHLPHFPQPDQPLVITYNSKTQCKLQPALNCDLLHVKFFYLMKQN